jgi:exopolysaccharide biosynthesis polyprenyl glycosylphosphotransferase
MCTRLTEDLRLREITKAVHQAEAADTGATAVGDRSGSSRLRMVVIGIDVLAMLIAWGIAFLPRGIDDGLVLLKSLLVLALTGLGGWLLASAKLYRARVSSVRTVEVERLLHVSAVLGLVAFMAATALDRDVGIGQVLLGAALMFGGLVIGRTGYRAWLRARRATGRHTRSVLIVGIDGKTPGVVDLLRAHPEEGFTVAGVVGDPEAAALHGLSGHWLGPLHEAVPALLAEQATGAMVVTSAIPRAQLNDLCRDLVRTGGHVQLTSSLTGIDPGRLYPQPVAYEPFLYLEPEPVALSRSQQRLKRIVDVVLALIASVLLAPVVALAALAILITDPGPILFRQRRVGLNNRPFTILKFRTMVVDAERRLQELADENERRGPLFKLEHDPRITRVGRILRATSIDELPQLINVLRGEMSLVGPRPALPAEVDEFDDELLARTDVPPGITGLWQVEARDNPSFSAYRRLDLFYVENWSVTFDLIIILATVESELSRLLRRRSRRD